MRFDWDQAKAAENAAKHGIAFERAIQVFDDPDGLFFWDREHSDGEIREKVIGMTDNGGIVVVVFTERREEALRIISARKATKAERLSYEKHEAAH